MKARLLLISIGIWMIGCKAEKEIYLFSSFKEPATEGLFFLYSKDAYHWQRIEHSFLKPAIGNQKVMRDPSIAQGPDATFHLVWTTSWRGDLGFGYAASQDLIHWSEPEMIPVMAWDTTTVNVWAPELFYDQDDDQFIIIWSSTIPFKFEKGIEEEKNNHRMYYTTTKDFKSFTDTKLFLDPGFSVIDAVIVRRGVHDFVLILKDNTRPNRNLKVAFGETPLGPWKNISEPFSGFLTEGPSVVQLEKDFLIYFDEYRTKTYGAVRTRDFIRFDSIDHEISVPVGHKHGTIFKADASLLQGLLELDETKGNDEK